VAEGQRRDDTITMVWSAAIAACAFGTTASTGFVAAADT